MLPVSARGQGAGEEEEKQHFYLLILGEETFFGGYSSAVYGFPLETAATESGQTQTSQNPKILRREQGSNSQLLSRHALLLVLFLEVMNLGLEPH